MSRRWDGKENLWALEEQDVLAKLALLRASADDAARHVRNLYVTFLLFSFYIAVIVFSTDDEQLLRETGATLPLLDIELPLLGFYSFIPWLVLFFHAHLLLQFFQLSRKLFNLDALLLKLPEAEERTYRELPFPLVFSYVLIGRHHPGLIRLMLRVVVKVTMILLPILLLAAIQWRFLPYHSFWITLDHQLVITLDLLLIALLWPRLSSRSGRWRIRWPTSRWLPRKIGRLVRPNRRWQRRGARVPPALALIFLSVIWGLMVPPGGGIEWMIRENQPWINWLFQRNLTLRERVLMVKAPPAEVLYAAHIDTDEERAEIWKDVGQALDLRHRDLRYADFWRATLWDVDLREAQLQGASLWEAQLQGGILWGAQLQGTSLWKAQLQGAHLRRAQLQGATLWEAQLQGAILLEAQLQGAILLEAQLQGADLIWAQLQGADLRSAELQGADLIGAQLQGADLKSAELQGADLSGAQLQGADLS
ncbi:MAG: pentapeptide repeat-containing protein, partial [Marichromatium sp.]|nr:pentapeptide repeat-containing protein [Marichromatium sp.]